MGDPRRFDQLAKLIAVRFPACRYPRVADVAGGTGYLQLALREHGFRAVTFDKRYKRAARNLNYRYGWFGPKVTEPFDLLAGMHPDEATDHIVVEAVRRGVPFVVVPCCVKPDATLLRDRYTFTNWVAHLERLARSGGYEVERTMLKISGKNLTLIGLPP